LVGTSATLTGFVRVRGPPRGRGAVARRAGDGVSGEGARASKLALSPRSSGAALPAPLVAAGDHMAPVGFNLALAHAATRLGLKAGSLPQYASTGGPILIAGDPYFSAVL